MVSIIVPNYNHAPYLKKRLDTILDQTFQDFELILLDDASTDNSLKVLENYKKHPKVTCFEINTKNSGSVFKQWVKGICLAKGDYIWIAESDDFAHPQFLEETVSILERHEDIGSVFTDSQIIDAYGNPKQLASKTFSPLQHLSASQKQVLVSLDAPSYFVNNLVVTNASSVLFRAESLKGINLDMLGTLANAGDMFAYISIVLQQSLFYIPKPLNFYRVHEANTTKTNVNNGLLHRDRLRIITYYTAKIEQYDTDNFNLKLFLKRHFFVCADFGFWNELKFLLYAYKNCGIINNLIYWQLRYYCFLKKNVPNYMPYAYRQSIKARLERLLK